MKVIQLVTRRQFRGAEVFAATLAEDLSRQGLEVWFCGVYPPPGTSLSPGHVHLFDLSGTNYLARIRSLVKLIRTVQPDVIQANGSVTLQFAIIARLLANINTRVVYRNISIISIWMRGALRQFFYQSLFRAADRIVSVSEESHADFCKTFPFAQSKIEVIKRGIEIPEPTNGVRQLPADPPYLLHVGSFSPEKNHRSLIRIFQKISGLHQRIRLVCLGDGELKNMVEEQVRELGLLNRVELLGFQKETQPFYARAYLLLVTSTIEGIPGVVMEAAAACTPTVAFSVGGIPELVKQDVNGVLVEPGNEDEFVARVIDLLNDEPKRNSLGANAYQFVKQNHNRDNTVHKFIN
ncbi:MAG: glycosyltransferase family 4 protein, partial [Bacteroidota bacterium]